MGHVSPPTPPWSTGPQLTRQLKYGPSSLEGERHRGMSGLPSATCLEVVGGPMGGRRLQL